jgi:hypothetical protein
MEIVLINLNTFLASLFTLNDGKSHICKSSDFYTPSLINSKVLLMTLKFQYHLNNKNNHAFMLWKQVNVVNDINDMVQHLGPPIKATNVMCTDIIFFFSATVL